MTERGGGMVRNGVDETFSVINLLHLCSFIKQFIPIEGTSCRFPAGLLLLAVMQSVGGFSVPVLGGTHQPACHYTHHTHGWLRFTLDSGLSF
ncbi:hypothetical protein XENOCAPTIV_002168 [Xenoophorus captivus]|uniref:Uncharacterized protein n=1 Tax=Xenoophorus captivus TaxID=1517983 RepID=A0ABV0RN62_9TELE